VSVNVFTYGFSRNAITQTPDASAVNRSGLTIPEIFPDNLFGAPPDVILTGYGTIGIGSLTNNVNNVYEWKDDFTHIVSTHTLKFGMDFTRIQKFDYGGTNTQGGFTFNGQTTGNAVADFLLGRVFNYTESTTPPNAYLFATTYEMYAQDDWKVHPNLTFNIGLRWGIYATAPNGYDKYNKISGFAPSLYDPSKAPSILADGQIRAGTGDLLNGIFTPDNQKGMDLPSSLRETHAVMPGPRFGFAWSPRSSQKTVLRGGYGIFYHWDNNNQENLRFNPPFTNSANISNTTLSNPAGGVNRIFPANLQAFDARYFYPTVQQWSFSVQRELPGAVRLSVAYVGNHAIHLDQAINLNQPASNIGVANGSINVNTVRPFLGYGTISYDDRSASARYNGLQISAYRRFDNGFLFQTSYTYSKAQATGVGQAGFAQINETGLTNMDQTNNLTVNYVYDLPRLSDSPLVIRSVFGGWETSGIAVFSSGFPFTVTISGDRAGVGTGGGSVTQRPNVIGTPTRYGNVNLFFDTNAFALAPLGTFGNEGVSVLRGPGISNNFTMNFYKNFRFRLFGTEGQNLRIGAEFFNIFNHPNFSAVGATVASPTYGKVTAALDPREIQFSGKLSF
jgi:hypothetical protein